MFNYYEIQGMMEARKMDIERHIKAQSSLRKVVKKKEKFNLLGMFNQKLSNQFK